mgnify:CR=1 FL=1
MLEIGGRAPEFTLPDHTGQNTSLSTLLRTGQDGALVSKRARA